MRRLVLLLMVGACGVESDKAEYARSFDPTCAAPSVTDLAALDAGLALWSDGFGVIVEEAAPAQTQIVVCFSDEPIVLSDGNSVNGVVRKAAGGFRIIIDRYAMRFAGRYYVGLVAHEFGHVFLSGNAATDHLPPDQSGIMSREHRCSGAGVTCEWSDDDIALITRLLQ